MSERFYQHATAIIESSHHIGDGTCIWAYAHVMENARIGANCNIGGHTFVENGARIGNNVTVKNHVCVWQGVHLDDDVFVGPLVAFTNDLYPRSPRMSQVQDRYADPANWMAPTLVERGASIGANATIIAGIRIGSYSFIAAGSTVTKDVEPFALMIGAPPEELLTSAAVATNLLNTYLPPHARIAVPHPTFLHTTWRGNSMTVPLLDLVTQYHGLRDELLPALERVMESAQFILGEELELFEDKFAAYCRAEHCVGVSSGTEALHLTLRAFGIGPGDEVITAANSFAATAFAIAYTGASPVFVDVNSEDYNIDVNLIEEAITPRTQVIIPVHLYGLPAEMDAISSIAQRHGLRVIEDACQAHGASYRGRPTGTLGNAGCFSFYPGKNLGAFGDGGAVVTNDRELADHLRLLRNYGQRIKNVHSILGYNSRLDTLQAAVLLVKLNYLDQWNDSRRAVANLYRDLLADGNVVLPSEREGRRHVYHQFVVRHENRDELFEYLRNQKVYCGIHYPNPLNRAAPFESARTVPDGAPVSSALSREILSLPVYPELTPEQVHHVAQHVLEFSEAGVNA